VKRSVGHPLGWLAACAWLAAAGCGSSEEEPRGAPLPADAAAQLERRLDEVERRYRDGIDDANVGACMDIQTDSFEGGEAGNGIDQILAGLPENVDPELRSAVEESFENLRELTAEDCAGVEPPPETEPEVVPEPPPPEETIPEETVPEETTPEELPPETVPQPTPQDPELKGPDLVPPGQGGTPPGRGGGGGGAEVPGKKGDDD